MGRSDILQLRVQRGVSAAQVHADGELDVASAEHLRAVLADAVHGARTLELDLSGVFFCDAGGAHGLTDAVSDAGRAGVGLSVRGVHGDVARVLGLLRVSLPA